MEKLMNYMDINKYRGKFDKLSSIIGKGAKNIVEIGAHYGEDTMRFRYFFPDSFVYCFECDPRNIQIIEMYCMKNCTNVKLIKKAASCNESTCPFYQSYKQENTINLPKKYEFIGIDNYVNMRLNASGSSSLKSSQTDTMTNAQIINV